MLETADAPESPPPPPAEGPRVAALEERVRRLEEVVARLQEARPAEVPAAQGASAAVADAVRESAGVMLAAGRALAPAAGAMLAAALPAAEAHARAQLQTATTAVKRRWLVVEVFADLGTMVRMYFDRRAPLGWTGRTLPLLLVIAIATSWLWLQLFLPMLFDKIPGAFALVMKVVDLFLAFVLWKLVARAVQRYREATAGLPPPR